MILFVVIWPSTLESEFKSYAKHAPNRLKLAPQAHLACQLTCKLAAIDNQHTVNEQVLDSLAVLVRVSIGDEFTQFRVSKIGKAVKGCPILDSLGVKDKDVSLVSFLQVARSLMPKMLAGKDVTLRTKKGKVMTPSSRTYLRNIRGKVP